VVSGS